MVTCPKGQKSEGSNVRRVKFEKNEIWVIMGGVRWSRIG